MTEPTEPTVPYTSLVDLGRKAAAALAAKDAEIAKLKAELLSFNKRWHEDSKHIEELTAQVAVLDGIGAALEARVEYAEARLKELDRKVQSP
jgi:chromosome segregation ATPase